MSEKLIDNYLTVDQAGAHLGLNRATVLRYCREGRLRYHRVGHRYFFSLDELKSFIERSAVDGPRKAKPASVKVRHLRTTN